MAGNDDIPEDESRFDEARGPARKAPRVSLFLLAPIASASGDPLCKARVRNLSATGLMADCDRRIEAGTRVLIDLRGVGEVLGTVAWANNDKVGIHFDTMIDPALTRIPVGQSVQNSGMPDYLRSTKFIRR